jgi:hypothetical protein
MTLDDIKAIDWKHFDFKRVPSYLVICFGVALLGLLLLLVGLFL